MRCLKLGKRVDKTDMYDHLSPEELHTHVRKNVSIPKYMDLFLFNHNISLSKLAQNAILDRMQEEQTTEIRKDVKKEITHQVFKKKITQEQKKDPRFSQKIQQAKQVFLDYFKAVDTMNESEMTDLKQIILADFPEMYVDIIKFEKWYATHHVLYEKLKKEYPNPVERLLKIKKHW